MDVGFTGTSRGTTEPQQLALDRFLRAHWVDEFHHGDCIGADHDAHVIASYLHLKIVLHPPSNPIKRAFCGPGLTARWPEADYLTRNRQIVHATDMLVACPKETKEQRRSGVWYTVRCARDKGVPVLVVPPDGNSQWDWPPSPEIALGSRHKNGRPNIKWPPLVARYAVDIPF
jgi:hypothetical protein